MDLCPLQESLRTCTQLNCCETQCVLSSSFFLVSGHCLWCMCNNQRYWNGFCARPFALCSYSQSFFKIFWPMQRIVCMPTYWYSNSMFASSVSGIGCKWARKLQVRRMETEPDSLVPLPSLPLTRKALVSGQQDDSSWAKCFMKAERDESPCAEKKCFLHAVLLYCISATVRVCRWQLGYYLQGSSSHWLSAACTGASTWAPVVWSFRCH